MFCIHIIKEDHRIMALTESMGSGSGLVRVTETEEQSNGDIRGARKGS